MIETKYTCDRCGHTQDKPDQMWMVGFTYKHTLHAYSLKSEDPQKTALWCRKCLEGFAILPSADKKKDEAPKPAPTIEDLIRDIVADAVSDAINNR